MKKKIIRPPKIAEWIVYRLSDPVERNSIIGDFGEIYSEKVKDKGLLIAGFWYWWHLFLSIPPFYRWNIYGSFAMFKNYIKVTFRNFKRHKGYSLINITGLTLGITCSVIIFLYVRNELSYDTFHEKADRIFRINQRGLIGNTKIAGPSTCPPLAGTVMNDYPEVEKAIRIYSESSIKIQYNNNIFIETEGYWVDASFFEVFSFKLLKGEPKEVLVNPNTIVLSKSASIKYFGEENPVGKTLVLDDESSYLVTGIMEDFPENSNFQFDFIASMNSMDFFNSTDWGIKFLRTFIFLKEGYNPKELEAKFPDLLTKYMGNGDKNFMGEGNLLEYFLLTVLKKERVI